MTVPELAESPGAGSAPAAERWPRARVAPLELALVGLAAVAVAIRIEVATQSVFADELSTYWISATHSLGGVLSLMYGTGRIAHAEITPPLSFLASWLTTQLGHTVLLLRAPELIAGTLTLPVVYLVANRTAGRRPALLATALTALSPFMIYYSAEARAYAMMMLFVLVSTLAMLLAVDTGRRRWWILYAVSACAAFYTHYTCAFVLGAQFLWVLWAHPEARRAALVASLAAAVGVLPWITGLINDFNSPTLTILSALSPFTLHDVRLDLEHWAIGYPYTNAGGLVELPGPVALVALGCSALLAAAGLIARVRGRGLRVDLGRVDRRLVLVFVLAVVVPVGEAVVSAGGNHIFGVRNMAASWPFLALCASAILIAGPPPIRLAAVALALIASALGAAKMLDAHFQRPDYQAAANFVARHARPGDVVVDETGALSPGPLTALDVSLHRQLQVLRAQAPVERDHPYGFQDQAVLLPQAIQNAMRAAAGKRVFLVTNVFNTDIAVLARRVSPAAGRFPARYRPVLRAVYPGLAPTIVLVYADVGSSPR